MEEGRESRRRDALIQIEQERSRREQELHDLRMQQLRLEAQQRELEQQRALLDQERARLRQQAEGTQSPPPPLPPTTSSPATNDVYQPWSPQSLRAKSENPWADVRRGMSPAQIRALLGEPDVVRSTDLLDYWHWNHPKRPYVAFTRYPKVEVMSWFAPQE